MTCFMVKSKSTTVMVTAITILKGTIRVVFCDVIGHSIKKEKEEKKEERKRIRGSERLEQN